MASDLKNTSAFKLFLRLHYARNEDWKTDEQQVANIVALIEADRKEASADRIAELEAVIAGLVEALLSAATALPVLRDMCHHAKLRIGAERASDMIDEITEALAKTKESRDV